jgi:hypothetical protein
MAERLAPLPATQVARVRYPVPARRLVWFSSTAIEIINRLKFAVAKAKEFPRLLASVCVLDVEYRMSKVAIVHYGHVIPKNKCVLKNPLS